MYWDDWRSPGWESWDQGSTVCKKVRSARARASGRLGHGKTSRRYLLHSTDRMGHALLRYSPDVALQEKEKEQMQVSHISGL